LLMLFLCCLGFANCGGHTNIRAASAVVSNIGECSCWMQQKSVVLTVCFIVNYFFEWFWKVLLLWHWFLMMLVWICVQAKFWKQYVEAHMAVNNDDAIKQIFSRCLLNCLQVPLWYVVCA
jgi:hypothetical protein